MNGGESLLGYMEELDRVLSRTVKTGIALTGVHSTKRPSRFDGVSLQQVIARNRRRAASFIEWRSELRPTVGAEMTAALLGLAWLANFEITAGDLYRAWPYVTPGELANGVLPEVAPEDIAPGLLQIGEECVAITGFDTVAKLRAIARVEWEIGVGPLHPFYDGCGRVSRYFSTLLCFWNDLQPPRHSSRDTYMAAATEGLESFMNYWTLAPKRFAPDEV